MLVRHGGGRCVFVLHPSRAAIYVMALCPAFRDAAQGNVVALRVLAA